MKKSELNFIITEVSLFDPFSRLNYSVDLDKNLQMIFGCKEDIRPTFYTELKSRKITRPKPQTKASLFTLHKYLNREEICKYFGGNFTELYSLTDFKKRDINSSFKANSVFQWEIFCRFQFSVSLDWRKGYHGAFYIQWLVLTVMWSTSLLNPADYSKWIFEFRGP